MAPTCQESCIDQDISSIGNKEEHRTRAATRAAPSRRPQLVSVAGSVRLNNSRPHHNNFKRLTKKHCWSTRSASVELSSTA